MQVSMEISQSGIVTFKRTLLDKNTLKPTYLEKPSVKCQYCGKCFDSKNARQCLRNHIKKGWCEVVNANPAVLEDEKTCGPCEFCGQKIVSEHVRNYHYRNVCRVLKENPGMLERSGLIVAHDPLDRKASTRPWWDDKGSDDDEEQVRHQVPVNPEDSQPRSCQFCGKEFRSKWARQALSFHIRTACKVLKDNPELKEQTEEDCQVPKLPSEPIPLTCQFCGKEFKSNYAKQALDFHINSAIYEHDMGENEANTCKVLRDHPELRAQLKTSKSKLRENISGANGGEDENDSVEEEHHETKNLNPLWCSHCDKTFERLQEFENHTRAVGRVEMCNKCGKVIAWATYADTSSARAAWSAHKKKCKADQPKPIKTYPCEKCGKVFKYRSRLRAHHKTCYSDKECNVCGRKFYNNYKLQMHKQASGGACTPRVKQTVHEWYQELCTTAHPEVKLEVGHEQPNDHAEGEPSDAEDAQHMEVELKPEIISQDNSDDDTKADEPLDA